MTTEIKSAYTIAETNLERQHLLAEFLNPLTLKALANIVLQKDATILDIGCGLGDTTLLLTERFPGANITGIDADVSLIEHATATKKLLHTQLNFIAGDALHLPFDDNSFDFVFTRYCLHHLTNSFDGLKEMKRVCKPGGIVFAHEPDISSFISYPESWAYQKLQEYLNLLFADALVGRKLVNHFKQLQLQNIKHHVESVIGDESNNVKQLSPLTGIAIGDALLKKHFATKEEHEALVAELQRTQNDADTIIIMPPGIAVWGTKCADVSSNYIYQHEK